MHAISRHGVCSCAGTRRGVIYSRREKEGSLAPFFLLSFFTHHYHPRCNPDVVERSRACILGCRRDGELSPWIYKEKEMDGINGFFKPEKKNDELFRRGGFRNDCTRALRVEFIYLIIYLLRKIGTSAQMLYNRKLQRSFTRLIWLLKIIHAAHTFNFVTYKTVYAGSFQK